MLVETAIGTFRTLRFRSAMSAIGEDRKSATRCQTDANDPKATFTGLNCVLGKRFQGKMISLIQRKVITLMRNSSH
jgi:hypothetical protein